MKTLNNNLKVLDAKEVQTFNCFLKKEEIAIILFQMTICKTITTCFIGKNHKVCDIVNKLFPLQAVNKRNQSR